MSALMIDKAAYWTAMDAFLAAFPLDREPAEVIESLRLSNKDSLPDGVDIHPAFLSVSCADLADHLQSHAATVACHLDDTATDAYIRNAVGCLAYLTPPIEHDGTNRS